MCGYVIRNLDSNSTNFPCKEDYVHVGDTLLQTVGIHSQAISKIQYKFPTLTYAPTSWFVQSLIEARNN